MGTAVIPAWVVPPPGQIADCHWIAHNLADSVAGAVAETLDWVTGAEPTADEAGEKMRAAPGVDGAYNTLAWLLGFTTIPPIQLPRRNADGSVVTADQLADEYMTGKTGLPEQWIEARQRAAKDAALYRRLAALTAGAH